MLGSGYTSRGFLHMALGYSANYFPSLLSGAPLTAVVLAITVLELIIGLGGLIVLIGGLIIIAHHTTTGRILIYLGGGAGFLGLLISFGYTASG